jgi:glyoxylase-like metal-dependent hydrolase (beta-lactamase superfamily II)
MPADKNRTSDVEVLQVKYGERITQKSVVFHDYSSYGLPDGDLHMEYNFWVIRSPEKTVLVDTGYDISKRDWLGEQSVMPTPRSLELLDINPLDVDMVITSHFHYDHIGYLRLFSDAQVVSGAAEHAYWFAKWKNDELDGEFTTAEDLEVVRQAESERRLRLVGEQSEVSPGITVYPVGGHCPGELVTEVQSASGPLILASDAAHFYEQIENEWPFFAFTDLDEMRSALSFINNLSRETGAQVIPGHDGRVRGRYPAVSGPAGAVATVLG